MSLLIRLTECEDLLGYLWIRHVFLLGVNRQRKAELAGLPKVPDATLRVSNVGSVYRWVHIQTTFHPPEKETFGGLRNLDGGEAAAHCCMSHSRGLKLTPSADFLRSLGLARFPKRSAVCRCADEMLRGGVEPNLFYGWLQLGKHPHRTCDSGMTGRVAAARCGPRR